MHIHPDYCPYSSVVLFDIDGTLLRGPDNRRSAGSTAMYKALGQVIGTSAQVTSVDFAGRTDRLIARLLLQAVGEQNPSKEQIDTLLAFYLENLSQFVDDLPYQVIGNPQAAVAALRRRQAIIGLGTGNIRAGARIKLSNADILHLFDLDMGGFGDDGEDRAHLIAAAGDRCDPTGFLPRIVVGDTPHDIQAAHACGALCIAVPFGRYTEADLRAAKADRIINRLDQSLADEVDALLSQEQ